MYFVAIKQVSTAQIYVNPNIRFCVRDQLYDHMMGKSMFHGGPAC